MDRSRLSLNTATVPRCDLREVVDLALAHGIGHVAPWRALLAPGGAAAAGKLLVDAGLGVSSLCRGGMFTHPTAAGRAAALEDNFRAVEEAREVGAPTLVLVCGPVVAGDVAGSYEMVRDAVAELLPHARAAGVRLGIEPLHPMMAADRSVVATLQDAADLLAEVDDVGVGVVVDAYHVWWDRRLPADARALAGRVLGLHVSDWVSPLTGGLLSGRGMMGDGVIDLPALVAAVPWAGPVEVEVISDRWAALDPGVVVETVVHRFERHV